MKLPDRLTFLDLSNLTSPKFLHRLSLFIVLGGILLRISQYLGNRSLWGDEVMLALNLVERSYLELLQPLDYNQAAPPGFLWIEKTAILILGNNEYALRLYPLIAGIISMIAFYPLSQWMVSAIAVPLALLLFACTRYTLYYATEVKQYSSDIMLALLLCLLLIPLRGQLLSKGRSLFLGTIGAIVVWFSHPVVFVLAGIEAANLITTPAEKRKPVLINRLPTYCLWIISFAVLYFSITANVMQNNFLQSSWGGEYPATVFDLVWLLDSFGRLFYRPLGFASPFDGIALVTFLIGCVAFFKLHRRAELLIVMGPVLATLAATYLHKYPFRARLILFLAPFFMLVIAEGIIFLSAQFNKRKVVGILGIALAGALLIPSTSRAARLLISPEKNEEVRSVLEYVNTHRQPGDIIYAGAFNHIKYYADKFNYSEADYIGTTQDISDPKRSSFSPQTWQAFMQANNLKSGQRVWFVFAETKKTKPAAVKTRLDVVGQELAYFEQPGAYTYLYQLK